MRIQPREFGLCGPAQCFGACWLGRCGQQAERQRQHQPAQPRCFHAGRMAVMPVPLPVSGVTAGAGEGWVRERGSTGDHGSNQRPGLRRPAGRVRGHCTNFLLCLYCCNLTCLPVRRADIRRNQRAKGPDFRPILP